jgi:phenylacetic acid degradation operon negative regulatory protein
LRTVRENSAVIKKNIAAVAMDTHPLSRIIGRFKREPSRTGSLIITVFGDAILPRGGSVWLGTLLRFLAMLEIDGGVVRTAMSRLASDGWLARDKVGRKSFYRLAAPGRERFDQAVQHVYHPRSVEWDSRLDLLLIGNGTDREAARAALGEAGFGSPMPGVWVAPSGTAVPSVAADAIRLDVTANSETGRRLIDESWSLDAMAAAYRDFLKTFAPLEAWTGTADAPSPDDAMLARVLLIHHYRRVLLRDPLLPASEQWLDRYGESLDGALPPPGPELGARFPA